MSGSGGIGGNLETSILMDVSGVRLASETAIDRLQELQGAVDRTSASFQSSTSQTASYTQSIDRAAEMVELLALKMLTLQANSERAGASAKKMAADFTGAATSGRSLTDMMNGGSLAAKKAADALELYNKNLQLSRQNTGEKTGISLPGDGRSLTAAMMGGSLAHANQQEANAAAAVASQEQEQRLAEARERDLRAYTDSQKMKDQAFRDNQQRSAANSAVDDKLQSEREERLNRARELDLREYENSKAIKERAFRENQQRAAANNAIEDRLQAEREERLNRARELDLREFRNAQAIRDREFRDRQQRAAANEAIDEQVAQERQDRINRRGARSEDRLNRDVERFNAGAGPSEASLAAEQALRDREVRLQRARELDARALADAREFRDREFYENQERARNQAQVDENIENDREQRRQASLAADARYERMRSRFNARIQADANRFRAGAQAAPEMRTAPNQINPRFFQMSRELRAWERARVAAQGMRDAIFQARVALDPMVGLEARLANEADEFAENMARAVRQGYMTQAQADELLQTYQQLTAQQVLQARNQQQSFLGMRNFGFVAQQGAYAIEDFAQVFGTMGLAGGIRAAGNNLTAMAATMGPMVGVFGSLAAAAVMIGLHLWESRDAAEEVNDQLERMEDLTNRVNEYQEYRVRLIMQMNKLQSSSHQELMAMYDENLSKQQDIHAVELARLETNRQLAQVTNRKQELDEANRRAEEEASKQIGKLQSVAEAGLTSGGKILLRIGRSVGGALAEAFSGAGSLIQSKEGVKLTEEQFNAETKLQIEMNRQEAILKRLNDEERKRRDLIEAQSRILQEQSQKLTSGGGFFGQIMFDAASGEEAAKRRMTGRGEFDVNDPMGANYEYANQFRDGRAVVRRVQEEFSEEALSESYGVVKGIRERLQMQEANGNNSLEVRARMQAEIVKLNETLLGIEERRFALFEAGKKAAEEVRSGIIGQYEGLNEVFRFEQGILETRRKINEQIELAVRANRVTEDQAVAARKELENVIALEEDRFWAEKKIEELQEREKGLRDQLQNNQAPTQLGGAVARGSAQALQILEQDRMTQLTKNENQPVVDELRRILREIQQQRDDLKAISITFPDAAALEGF